MADKEVILGHATNTDGTGGVRILLHDNGNGTYSLSTSADFTGTLSIGNIAIDQTTPGISNNVAVNGDHTTKLSDLLGTDATGVLVPAGATGLRGWLSSIWNVLQARIPILGAHGGLPVEGVASGTPVPVSGAVGVSGNVTIGSSALPVNAAQENGGHLANVDLHIGTPADAVTGWPDQTVAPVSTTAIEGEVSKALGHTGDAFRIANTGDGSPTGVGLLDAMYGLLSAYGSSGAFVTSYQNEHQSTVSATGKTFLSGPGPWRIGVSDSGGFSGSFKFQAGPFNDPFDIAVIESATGAIIPAGTTITYATPQSYIPLIEPMAFVWFTCVTAVSGSLLIDNVFGVPLTIFGYDAPGTRRGGVGTVQDAANQPKHLAAIANTLVKDRAGLLGRVVINKAGAGGNTLTLYDGTDAGGTVLAVIDTTVIAQRDYQVAFTTGLYAVLATGTAADVTLTYA